MTVNVCVALPTPLVAVTVISAVPTATPVTLYVVPDTSATVALSGAPETAV